VLVRADPLQLTPIPGWDSSAPVDLDAWRACFAHVTPFRVGIEDELFLHDPATGDLAALDRDAREALEADPRFASELPAGQIETISPPCATVAEAIGHLRRSRADLADRLAGIAQPLAAGTHPGARLPLAITDERRYRLIAREFTWAARRGLSAGMHVHVSVPGADCALAVHDAIRSYLPLLTALAANAPFLEGEDTGLATVRPKLNDGLPRQGIPPALGTIEQLASFIAWGATSGAFPDASQLWWEVRLHARLGTLELRVPDTQTDLGDAAAIASVAHALVVWLAERHAAGEELPVHERARIDENRWRALRHGIHGYTADLSTGRPEPVRETIARLLGELAPTAHALGCEPGLARARSLLAGTGADRQREVAARAGLEGLLAWLAVETVRDAR
jgi:carboxylate-amine ligase